MKSHTNTEVRPKIEASVKQAQELLAASLRPSSTSPSEGTVQVDLERLLAAQALITDLVVAIGKIDNHPNGATLVLPRKGSAPFRALARICTAYSSGEPFHRNSIMGPANRRTFDAVLQRLKIKGWIEPINQGGKCHGIWRLTEAGQASVQRVLKLR